MKRALAITLFISVFSASAAAGPKPAYMWNKLGDGIFYATYSFATSEGERTTMHAFLIDPKILRMDVAMAKDEAAGATAIELAKRGKALLMINGGFFTPAHKSIGLIIKGGKELSPIHKTSWWSIFAIGENGPRILPLGEFKASSNWKMALQVGPRLVIDGEIPKLKEGSAARSAVGITNDGFVVIAITQDSGISMTELARRMGGSRFKGGLECPNAMALDGGGSSQLYARVGKFELSLTGFSRVTNGLGVYTR